MSKEEYSLFWTNFKEFLKNNPCPIDFESASHQFFQITKLRGYDLRIDFCVSYKEGGVNNWKTRVELYGLKNAKNRDRYTYFKNNLEKMRKVLPDYEIDFRKLSEDDKGIGWKLYVGTNDLVHRQCEDIEIYRYYVKTLNCMVEALAVFFEPYKK